MGHYGMATIDRVSVHGHRPHGGRCDMRPRHWPESGEAPVCYRGFTGSREGRAGSDPTPGRAAGPFPLELRSDHTHETTEGARGVTGRSPATGRVSDRLPITHADVR